LVPVLRFGNRSETLARCAVVQPLRVYGTGYLLATALRSNLACGVFSAVRRALVELALLILETGYTTAVASISIRMSGW
jgi:hypothetical protein